MTAAACRVATAYWTVSAGRGELRGEDLAGPGAGEALVRMLASGISRGTELLVHRHDVPPEVAETMRAPYQCGELPGPVKYGYLASGVVEAGDEEWVGRRVFALHPHQDRFVLPVEALVPIPEAVPSDRAVLAGTVETAVNALWDAAPRIGDRIAVVGSGMVGASVALLLDRHPVHLEVVETSAPRRELLLELGVSAVVPQEASGDCDMVFHTSATPAGLRTSLDLLGIEGQVIELSWYGSEQTQISLGGVFHARRLSIRGSQVGRVSPARATRKSFADRMGVAMHALSDERFDRLLAPAEPFAHLPQVMRELADGRRDALCQLISYPSDDESRECSD